MSPVLDPNSSAEVMRPVTLYVSKVQTEDLSIALSTRDRVYIVDMEINLQQAEQLVKYFQERIAEGGSGIRVRFEGHLVHG